MEGTLTLSDVKNEGDIPQLNYDSRQDFDKIINYWLGSKKDKKTVFVCFPCLSPDKVKYEEEHPDFFISNRIFELKEYCEEVGDSIEAFGQFNDFAIFEFKTYEDAFGYCIDLKEGL